MLTVGGIAVAAILWLPPLVDQLIHDPGNLGQIVNYALSDRSGTRPSNAVRAIGNEMSAFPFAKDEPKPFHDSDIQWYRHRNPVIAAAPFLYLGAAPLAGGLTPATNATAPIRHLLPDFFDDGHRRV